MNKQNEITKALLEIAKAIEDNEGVASIKVIINLKKQNPSKAKPESK